jgi:hypothetical protein
MSTPSHAWLDVLIWVVCLGLFFAVVYAAAKSKTPGSSLAEILLLTSGLEGLIVWGIWQLLKKADRWRGELNDADTNNEESNDKR